MIKNKKEVKKAVAVPTNGDLQAASLTLIGHVLNSGAGEMEINHIGMKIKGQPLGDWQVAVRPYEPNAKQEAKAEAPTPVVEIPKDGSIVSDSHYMLLIDQDRDEALGLMLQIFSKLNMQLIGIDGMGESQATRMKLALKGLTAELVKKHHEKGWCKDPDCRYEKK